MRQRVLRSDQRTEADEMTVTDHVLDVLLDRERDADEPDQREPQPNELADVAARHRGRATASARRDGGRRSAAATSPSRPRRTTARSPRIVAATITTTEKAGQ